MDQPFKFFHIQTEPCNFHVCKSYITLRYLQGGGKNKLTTEFFS